MASCKVISSEQSFSSLSASSMSSIGSGHHLQRAGLYEQMGKIKKEFENKMAFNSKGIQQRMFEDLLPNVSSVLRGMNDERNVDGADESMQLAEADDSCVTKSHFKSESMRMEQTNDRVSVEGKKMEKFHDSEALASDIETSEEYHHIYEGDADRVGAVAKEDMAKKLRASMYLQVDDDGHVIPTQRGPNMRSA